MSIEESAAAIISKVGLWWPLAEEAQLRRAAEAYDRVTRAALASARTATDAATLVTAGASGPAATAFATHWSQFDGAADAGLPATAAAAAAVAAALRHFAEEVSSAKHKIINLAIEIGVSIAVGVALAIWTAGGSAAAAAVRTAMLVARGWLIAQGLTGVVGYIVATALVGVGYGAVEGFITGIVAQIAKTVLSDGDGISFGETAAWTLGGAISAGVLSGGGTALKIGYRSLRYGEAIAVSPIRGLPMGADEVVPAAGATTPKDPGAFINVNPSGSTTNCIDCFIALDETLAGRPMMAADGPPKPGSVLAKRYTGVFHEATPERIVELLREAGPGARLAVLAGPKPGQTEGHVFMGTNQGGHVRFIDGQRGMPGITIMDKSRKFWYIWSNVP